ncbi:hypothetical protein BRC79_07355 [Halobacteriales archaeon QH_8_67_27]|nr:MAG: hypothetical protein BRC79_07355 [Halobacteriales archaeon QH_8_67_27]
MLDPGVFHVLLLTLAGFVTSGLAVYAWRHRGQPSAKALSAVTIGFAWWACTEILSLSQTGVSPFVRERVQ